MCDLIFCVCREPCFGTISANGMGLNETERIARIAPKTNECPCLALPCLAAPVLSAQLGRKERIATGHAMPSNVIKLFAFSTLFLRMMTWKGSSFAFAFGFGCPLRSQAPGNIGKQ